MRTLSLIKKSEKVAKRSQDSLDKQPTLHLKGLKKNETISSIIDKMIFGRQDTYLKGPGGVLKHHCGGYRSRSAQDIYRACKGAGIKTTLWEVAQKLRKMTSANMIGESWCCTTSRTVHYLSSYEGGNHLEKIEQL